MQKLSSPPVHESGVYFGKIVSLLLCFASLSVSYASEKLFGGVAEWQMELRGKGAVADFVPSTDKGVDGVTLNFDFENIDPDERSVWAGISTRDTIFSSSESNFAFRVSSNDPALLKVSITDGADMGYDVLIPVSGGGNWEEVDIFLDRSSFTSRWGKSAAEAPPEIVFPITRIAISVIRSEEYPKQGTVVFADLP